MKVENRKLFSNRDARSKLANMGGIMTSSPELMGEAQRFAEGSKDAVAANNDESAYLRLGTRMPVEESRELVKKIAEQSSRLGGFDESQGLTEGDLKSAITTVYFDSIRLIERLKRDPKLPASQVSDERLQALLMKRLTNMFGVDESIINETIAEVQPAAVAKNQAIPFSEQSPFRINPYRDFDKRSIADGIMSADPRRTRPSNEEVMALQGFTGTRAPVESPFVQESVDQLGSPSIDVNPLSLQGFSSDSPIRTESPQGLSDLSIDQMMNAASTRPAPAREGIETLSTPAAEFVPRFPNDTQFQQDMVARDTPSGVVTAPQSTDFPRSGPPSMGFPTALEQARLEKQFQSDVPVVSGVDASEVQGSQSATQADLVNEMALRNREMASEQSGMLSPAEELASRSMDLEAEREARILAESMALIAERDPEAIARINAGTSISSRVNNIVEPVEAQAQTFPDIKPGQGYGTEAFGPGNTFTSGRELASTEGESLLSSVGNTMRSNPLRDAIAAGRVTMANTRAEEAEEQKQAEITESEQLLAAQDQQRDAQRMMEINATPPATPPAMSASDLARLADAGDENAINQIRLNEIAALSTASDMSLGKRNPALDSITQATIDDGPGDAAIRTVAKKKRNLTQITSTIAELEEFLRLNPGDTQALARLKAAQDAIPVAESEVVTAERKERGGQTPKEFRDQEEDLVNAQGGLNSMRLEDSKDIRALAAAEDSKNINLQGPNFVIPDVTAEIGKGDGADDSDDAGAAGTGKTLFAPSTVKDYQKMYADMLGGKDKDSAKDKWNDFAMIGFAIAAGQDPSALTNIAQGMLDGTKMMKEDRSIEQARQDKINMMAIQSAEEDRRTALAARVRAGERSQDQVNRIALTDLETRQRLKDEGRKSKRSLELYEAKLKIAEKYDKPDSILKTDPALAAISKAFDGIDYAMLGSDDNAFTALEKMGFDPVVLKRFADEVKMPYGGGAAVSNKVTLNEI